MVANCCRFLCYFCRISRQNQKAMFDHLSYLLENSSVGLASPSMRGSTPLDVAAASVMDNNELALALREPDLEKVVQYLAGCGLQSCLMLVRNGYPDIGWNPVEGERYLDFLRFAVFCNGESVEENANVVVRLLIRRPECFGPALRGEGGDGLLAAMEEAIKISQDLSRDDGHVVEPDMSAGFCPDHKAAMVLFLDRVYGIEDQNFLLHLLEVCFLPDLRAAASLDTVALSATDMALALNRYLCTAVLPLLTKCAPLFAGTEPFASLIDSLLHTVYRLSKGCCLTKAQRDAIEECLLAACGKLRPSMMQHLLRRLVFDVPLLNEHTKMPLKLLTNHYERCWKYYCLAGGWGSFGAASDEELHLSRKLFWGIFDALSLKCGGWSSPPDYMESNYMAMMEKQSSMDSEGNFTPQPADTTSVTVPEKLDYFITRYTEHNHEKWCIERVALCSAVSQHSITECEPDLSHKSLHNSEKLSSSVSAHDKEAYCCSVRESLKTMLSWGWSIDRIREGDPASLHNKSRRISQASQLSFEGAPAFSPRPIDMSNVTLSRDMQAMAELLAENYHNIWARKKKMELEAKGVKSQELDTPAIEKRFAYTFLQQLITYVDQAHQHMMEFDVGTRPKGEKIPHEQQIKFFGKVVLPLVDQYFKNHRLYFLSTAIHPISSGGHASNKEKEMVTRTVMKTGLESVKAALRLFFESAAEDLEKTQENLKLGQFTHSREQPRGVTQIINYTTFALLPVLSSLFEHIGQNMFGEDLILDDVQVSCYRILYSLYLLGTNKSIYVERQRPALGKCLAAFSAAFPVAFLEPHTNKFNSFSIFNSKGAKDRAGGEVCPLIPNLEKCLEEIMELAESGMRYTQMPHVMEVVLPMLCSYMSNWWEHGPENNPDKADSCCTSVTSEHMNTLLGNILKIIYNNLGIDEGAWMKRLAVFSQPIISKAKAQLLKTHFLPLMEKLKKKAAVVLMDEEQSKAEGRGEMSETELLILDQFTVLIRDLYAFYPLLIRFVDYNRARWLKESNPEAEELFRMVAEVFIFWAKSHGIVSDQERKKMKRKGDRYSMQTSLIVATLKRLLPVGLNICAPGEQELIALAKNRFTQLEDPAIRWQMALYRDLPNHYEDTSDPQKTVERVLDIAHVLFHLDQVEHPQRSKKAVWHKLLSKQRKRAVVACFRMAPLYNLPRHRAVNLFLQAMRKPGEQDYVRKRRGRNTSILCITHPAVQQDGPHREVVGFVDKFIKLDEDNLYMAYADIMAKEKEMEKQKLLYQQARLHDRGAAEMVLQTISASKGEMGPMVASTLKLGIAILNGGNSTVQQKMLDYLKDKKDVGFFQSLAGLMQSCSVLDLNAFERQNKAEGLGMVTEEGSDFQNYLRTQIGNNTTVNIIISTVDYLLRVQGPCTGNQQSLAHSRLWDAVVGFLHVFAHMQMKLSQDSSQIELLKELMDLQKDMVVMLLSMLEGNVVNGTIGKQMVDMLVESSNNVEMILKFFDMFLKLKDLTSSDASRSVISKRDFHKAMESHKHYTQSETEFLLSCAETDENELLDYEEFVERFHEPAKDIGFNVAVLLTNLSEHMPHDTRLQTFLELADSVLNYFQPYLGRIEIMGSAKRIERVYFEISESSRTQWEKPQVKESKRQFIFDVVNEGGEKEKMELFVNFCEDTIFEMQLAAQMSDAGERSAVKEESEREKPDEENSEMGFFSVSTVRMALLALRYNVMLLIKVLSTKSLKKQIKKIKSMTVKDMVTTLVSFYLSVMLGFLHIAFSVARGFCRIFYNTFMGGNLVEGAKTIKVSELLADMPDPTQDEVRGEGEDREKRASPKEDLADLAVNTSETELLSDIFGLDLRREGGQYKITPHNPNASLTELLNSPVPPPAPPTPTTKPPELRRRIQSKSSSSEEKETTAETECEPEKTPEGGHVEKQEKQQKNEKMKPKVRRHHTSKSDEPDLQESAFLKKIIAYQRKLLNYFARNFYNMRMLALFVAFAINFILLFYKVSTSSSVVEEREVVYTSSQSDSRIQWDPLGGEAMETKQEVMDEGGEPLKPVTVRFVLEESTGYMEPMLRILAVLHTVPLVIFKREKEVARKLEFDGLYITEQPSEDDIKGQWDRLVINTQSFPNNYWDKFVKRKVMDKYGEFYGHDRISELLGMDKAALDFSDSHKKRKPRRDSSLAASFLYLAWYMTMSILGHYNNFFFAAHLLDIAMGFKTLRTILSSVTHNGKQLTCEAGQNLPVVVYLYTVVAFNFFRKFYNKSEDGELPDMKCDDMLTCYMFHMYVGVRAGGGIGDQIEDPAGDEYEIYRIIFDITFFFFVIVILLAIIQGLIIDAFGELRDQQEQVKEDMETKCFICGIGNDYFDTVPHGFETHTLQEHNLANYLFFVMYLINKDETEHTGQVKQPSPLLSVNTHYCDVMWLVKLSSKLNYAGRENKVWNPNTIKLKVSTMTAQWNLHPHQHPPHILAWARGSGELGQARGGSKNLRAEGINEKLREEGRRAGSFDRFRHITYQTNLYTTQKDINTTFTTNEKERMTFLTILMYMGIAELPAVEYYWIMETRDPQVANLMSSKRFRRLKRVVHFNDNTELPGTVDRFFKVRPLFSFLNSAFRREPQTPQQSVDEVRVAYKGKTAGNLRQYIQTKPDNWGFKLFSRASDDGFIPTWCYTRGRLRWGPTVKTSCPLTPEQQSMGASSQIVSVLASTMSSPTTTAIFADNFFTSLELVRYLRPELQYRDSQ
ncbi:hypothetical protein F7725_014813 [Dissostichus mawsoni]|uniref:Ryanodine receptor 2 n=1 Tax=Dissostichus mawsoni TaxID=36200 RepID=A0A7J5YX81_DISMA|nr:hypothetical protein F7725_014813 [Dissostichus mawsoni]